MVSFMKEDGFEPGRHHVHRAERRLARTQVPPHQPVDVGPRRSGDHARRIASVRAASARRAAERLGAIFNICRT
jgi:hypothetical protein